jgi:hypothetical protein
MAGTPGRAWIIEVDDVETRYPTRAALLAALSDMQRRSSGSVAVMIDAGPVEGWRRFLGGAKRVIVPCFAIEWEDRYASLIFHDEAWSEYRAIDSQRPVAPDETTRTRIAHGELTPYPIEECMDKARAFDAVREFITTDARPPWLSYRYVR